MAWYNLTAVNATNLVSFTQSINNIFMFGHLGNILLITLFVICYFSFTLFNNNPKYNLMFASFIIAIFSIFFRLLSLVPDATPFMAWAMFAIFGAIALMHK